MLLLHHRLFTYVIRGAELILQAFSHFTYVTAHSDSPSFPSLHLRHSSFSNPSLALPTSQVILQHFRCFTYDTAHSPTLLSLLLRHRIFTYVTWRAAHVVCMHLVLNLPLGGIVNDDFYSVPAELFGIFPHSSDYFGVLHIFL